MLPEKRSPCSREFGPARSIGIVVRDSVDQRADGKLLRQARVVGPPQAHRNYPDSAHPDRANNSGREHVKHEELLGQAGPGFVSALGACPE